MSSQNSSVSIVQRPDRFGRPSGVLGAFAERSALPSGVRGIPSVLGEGHWAGSGPAATKSEITVTCQGRMSLGRGEHHGGYEDSRPPMPIRLSERSPNIDLHTCKMKIRHRCFGWRSSASRKTTEARRIERKHIQRWDLQVPQPLVLSPLREVGGGCATTVVQGISPSPVLIQARIGAGRRDFSRHQSCRRDLC